MVSYPAEYPWSSYQHNAQGESNELLKPHETYNALDKYSEGRRKAYRDLLRLTLDAGQIEEIRKAVQYGVPLGSDRFREEVERILGRRVGQAKMGRPRNVRLEQV